MREVIANVPTAGNKARACLSKEDSARYFGPPPLIAGEDPAQYEAIRTQILAAVQPLDFLEEILVNDVVNLVWETRRLRRLMRNVLNGDNENVLTGEFTLRIETAERIDRMIAGDEARRNVALREIDRHRATPLAAALRQAAAEVLDAEFKEIPPSLTEGEAGRDERP
jgi:hypothetical protein